MKLVNSKDLENAIKEFVRYLDTSKEADPLFTSYGYKDELVKQKITLFPIHISPSLRIISLLKRNKRFDLLQPILDKINEIDRKYNLRGGLMAHFQSKKNASKYEDEYEYPNRHKNVSEYYERERYDRDKAERAVEKYLLENDRLWKNPAYTPYGPDDTKPDIWKYYDGEYGIDEWVIRDVEKILKDIGEEKKSAFQLLRLVFITGNFDSRNNMKEKNKLGYRRR